MATRLLHAKVAPGGYQSILGMEKFVHTSDIEGELLELMRLRVSQINGCEFCLAMHAHGLRADFHVPQRHLDLLPAWRESEEFSAREKITLAYAEAVTKLTNQEVPDDVYNAALAEFGEKQLVELTFAIIAINSWNRVNVAFHTPPQVYE
jgi:AhpD family alkylhydroperoxidase